MEPVTLSLGALMLMGAAVVTDRQKWEREIEARQSSAVVHVDRQATELPIWGAAAPPTQRLVAPHNPAPILDARDFLHAEIQDYARLDDGWNGDGSQRPTAQSVGAADAFLDAIPAGMPLPKPMISSCGHIEFFWDLPSGYADISFDAEGAASFFARDQRRQELFLDELQASAFTRAWFEEALGHISAPATTHA